MRCVQGNSHAPAGVSVTGFMQLGGGVSPETSTAARGGLVMAVRSLLSTLVCASTLFACSATAGAEPAGATCEQFQSTPSIQQTRAIAVGADLTIVLCSNPSTGYSWGEPQIGDASVLKLVDRTVRAPAEASLPIVGAAGAEVVTLRGQTAGTTTLSIGYGQPWAGGAQGEGRTESTSRCVSGTRSPWPAGGPGGRQRAPGGTTRARPTSRGRTNIPSGPRRTRPPTSPGRSPGRTPGTPS